MQIYLFIDLYGMTLTKADSVVILSKISIEEMYAAFEYTLLPPQLG